MLHFHSQDTETYKYPALPTGVETMKVPVNWKEGRDQGIQEAVAKAMMVLQDDNSTIVPRV